MISIAAADRLIGCEDRAGQVCNYFLYQLSTAWPPPCDRQKHSYHATLIHASDTD